MLSQLEYPTPAIYHASNRLAARVDKVQSIFLQELGLSEADDLKHFHLAPLNCRRDIALLGDNHRSVLGDGPNHFGKFFQRAPKLSRFGSLTRLELSRHDKQLCEISEGPSFILRSIFGLTRVYNLLPEATVNCISTLEFQNVFARHVKACSSCWFY